MERRNAMRTALGRVRGHGSAKSGTEHFWHQRLTAIANVPLAIGSILIMLSLVGRDRSGVIQVLSQPLVSMVLAMFIVSASYHMKLGMQVIIEDYVHSRNLKIATIIASTFFAIAVGIISLFALTKIATGV